VCFALKIIRNRDSLSKQAETEVGILTRLRVPADGANTPTGDKSEGGTDPRSLVVQLHQHFRYKDHTCLVFEALGVNLLQLLQQNGCRGLSLSLVRFFAKQLLQVRLLAPNTHTPPFFTLHPPKHPHSNSSSCSYAVHHPRKHPPTSLHPSPLKSFTSPIA
jgi:hypothetical protein